MYDIQEIGNNIQKLMNETGVTVNNICSDYTDSFGKTRHRQPPDKYIDISRATFNKILKGQTAKITMDQFISICNYFNVSMSNLLGETDYKDNEERTAGEYTGLSPKSIENLHRHNDKKAINYLFEHHFDDFLKLSYQLHKTCAFTSIAKLDLENGIHEDGAEDAQREWKMLAAANRLEMQETIGRILDNDKYDYHDGFLFTFY